MLNIGCFWQDFSRIFPGFDQKQNKFYPVKSRKINFKEPESVFETILVKKLVINFQLQVKRCNTIIGQ